MPLTPIKKSRGKLFHSMAEHLPNWQCNGCPDVVALPDADAQVLEFKVENNLSFPSASSPLASATGQNLDSSEYGEGDR